MNSPQKAYGPDFIVNCYTDMSSVNSRERKGVSSFFLTVKDHKSLDGGLLSGGKENITVDIGTQAGAQVDSFIGDATLSNDSFILRKNIDFGDGRGYVVEFVGNRVSGKEYYFGKFRAIDKSTNKENPFYTGFFQVSPSHFLKKYNLNTNESKN